MNTIEMVNTSVFHRENARAAYAASKLAYTNAGNIKSFLSDNDVTFIDDKETNTQAFVAVNDESINIAFRGTKEIVDWLTNFDTDHRVVWYPRLMRSITYHNGFYEAFHSVAEIILNIVNENPGKPIHIEGHSLGGALANVCAFYLEIIHGIEISNLYTFGSPRVFDKGSADFVDSKMKYKMHRVVNNNDIVCHVPPEFADFSHAGEMAYFEEDGTLHVDEVFTWWQEKRYALAGRIDDIGKLGTDGLKDHFLDAYGEYV